MYNVSDTYKELIKAPVRYTGISGAARLRDGTIIHLTDDNIAAGSLSITQKMNGRGDFRPGGVYSGELSCSLKGFAGKTSDLDGAAIRLAFILYHDSDMQAAKSETVPLGRFYVDGSSIKRRNDTVTLSAFDGMALFDVEATERSGTLYELVCGACSAAGVSLGMTQAEFEALPNAVQTAKINTARIQTERDLLMYVGMMTASFARISRSNELEFVPLTCERNDGGVIVPVREIAGNIRFNTDFSDDTTCIAKLFTRRNGAAVYSTSEISAGGSEKLAVMELNENPLLAELSDDVVAAVLNNELLQMYKCLNRVFDSSFTGDPALEIGDYVRLRGGAIDTDRGYATGMITSQIWRYRGQHTIKCSMPSSLSAVGETEVQTLALDDSSSDITAPPVRTQPKSQTEKQIDELRKQLSQAGGTAEKLQTSGTNTSAVTNEFGGITTAEGGVEALNIEASPSLKYFDISIPSLKFSISGNESKFSMAQAGSVGEKRIELSDTAGILIKSNRGSEIRIELPYAGIGIVIDKEDFAIWTSISKLYTAGGTLYFNGKKVLLEG
ncbi:MAG TPA: hypothetical protein DHW32_11105 [Ruminococcaceae bacterium]|nr:hypothetical protein [Oscillospiraceae bacterium]HCK51269.1 hypothetical protein [Oscillospiraceae bacterium]